MLVYGINSESETCPDIMRLPGVIAAVGVSWPSNFILKLRPRSDSSGGGLIAFPFWFWPGDREIKVRG